MGADAAIEQLLAAAPAALGSAARDDVDLADDLLEGAEAIAAFLGKDARQIYHMVTKRQIPAFKLGAVLHARRSTLKQFFADREAAAVQRSAK